MFVYVCVCGGGGRETGRERSEGDEGGEEGILTEEGSGIMRIRHKFTNNSFSSIVSSQCALT